MPVKTTLNINRTILEEINTASENLGIPRSEIIIMLLMKVMSKDTSRPLRSGSVKYQDKDNAEMWHRFHITFREDVYGYFTDLRNILRSSLSRLVAFAVKKYLHELLHGDKSDKCRYQNYIISRETANGVIFWKILWGLPENVEKFIQLC